jgi:hypothetical protein
MKNRWHRKNMWSYPGSLLFLIAVICGLSGPALAKSRTWTIPAGDNARISITAGITEQECTRKGLLQLGVPAYLAEKGLSVSYASAVLLSHRDGDILFVQCKNKGTGSSAKFLALVKDQTERGLLLVYDRLPKSSGAVIPVATVRFDSIENTVIETAALPDDCIVQITDTIQSFIFVVYDCALVFDARNCVGSVASFASSVFLTYYFCQPETPATVK